MTIPAPAAVDAFGRRFRYLRLSVTEICNFRCTYCLPNGYVKSGSRSFLSPAEAGRLIATFSELGLSKVRLTGGEPSVRKDLTAIIAQAASQPRIDKVAMTTNGWNLSRKIDDWTAAGLTHLNVSIDALKRDAFAAITGHDRLDTVLEGFKRAEECGLNALKINAVLLRDGLENDFSDWTEFVRDRDVSVRFIELMRTGDNKTFFDAQHVRGDVLRDWLLSRGWVPRARGADDGPAIEFTHPDHRGRIGLIAPYAPGFCDGCNRLRVTAVGGLRLCLFGQGAFDLRPYLRSDDQTEALKAEILGALVAKPLAHQLHTGATGRTLNLAQTGG